MNRKNNIKTLDYIIRNSGILTRMYLLFPVQELNKVNISDQKSCEYTPKLSMLYNDHTGFH